MGINFKIATEKDVPEILTMMEQFNAIENYPFDKSKSNRNILDFLSDANLGRIWLVQNDNTKIGYFVLAFGYSFEYGGRDAFIDELFLKAEYRRIGIGGLIIDFISKEALKLGVKVIHLEVEPHNDGGVKLYRKNGFKDNGRILLSKKVNDKKK
jgi:ribosomal protein S18 acetylase RimI-like enzyme